MKSLITTLLLITGISMAQQPPNPLPPSIPQRISFQAMITDTLGNPVTDGTHNFTFRINRPTQAGQVQTIWEEAKQVAVVDGLISTILGSVNPIGFIPFSDNYFLRVALDNEVISVSPLTSVPFAFNALRAMGANNATHADTANFTHHADSSGFAHHTEHAEHADTANIVMNAPIADTANFAHQAQHSVHADTASFAGKADTANYANNLLTGSWDNSDSGYIRIGNMQIMWGINTSSQSSITFSPTFSQTPSVVITPVSSTVANNIDLSTVTTSSANVNMTSATSGYHWLAIGQWQ